VKVRGGCRRGPNFATWPWAVLQTTDGDGLELTCAGRQWLRLPQGADVSIACRDGWFFASELKFSGQDLPWGPVSFWVNKRKLESVVSQLRQRGWPVTTG
jgi:hypothetical protein